MFNFELFRIRMTSPWWRALVAAWQSRHPGSVPWRGAPPASPPPPRRSAPWTPASSPRTGCCPATTGPGWTSKCGSLWMCSLMNDSWVNYHVNWGLGGQPPSACLRGHTGFNWTILHVTRDKSRLIWAPARALAVNSPLTLVGRIELHRIIINCHLHSFERLQITFRVKTGHS